VTRRECIARPGGLLRPICLTLYVPAAHQTGRASCLAHQYFSGVLANDTRISWAVLVAASTVAVVAVAAAVIVDAYHQSSPIRPRVVGQFQTQPP
jgi:hypothetical protein